MPINLKYGVIISALLLTVPAQAESIISKSEKKILDEKCVEFPAAPAYMCQQKKIPILEKRLDFVLKQAENKIKSGWGYNRTKEDLETLRAAQRGWLTYRDNQCRPKTPMESGEPASLGLQITYCLIRKTTERSNEIKFIYLGE